MHPPKFNLFKTPRRPATVLGILMASAVFAASMAIGRIAAPAAPVFAACQSANQACQSDATKTAVVDVSNVTVGGGGTIVDLIEPSGATSWTISGYWGEAPGGNCTDVVENATVDVTWNGSTWVTSNFVGTAHINAAAACALWTCTNVGTHSYKYRLYVDVTDPIGAPTKHLRQVVFQATSVPNGTDYGAVTCAAGSSHTPAASSYSATDSGSFECTYNCSQTGTTLNIVYN